MTLRFPMFFAVLTALTFSCNTSQEITDLSQLKKEIEMKKGGCFGTCPVYTLTIYENGIASFEGMRDTEKLGLHTKKLSKKDYKGIKHAFQTSNFFTLDDNYPSNVSDLPKIAISYHQNGQSKTVTGDLGRPQIVVSLENILTQVAESEGWTLKEAAQNNH